MVDYTSEHQTPSRHRLGQVLPVQVAIGVATAPILAAFVGGRLLASAMHNLGQWSEELFRGDRLPSINSSPATPPTPNTPDTE